MCELGTGGHVEVRGSGLKARVQEEAAGGGQDGAPTQHHPPTQLHPSAVQEGRLGTEDKRTIISDMLANMLTRSVTAQS